MREHFSRFVGPVIDKVLGLRCTSFGYQYSEIVGSLSSVYFCSGDCVENVTSHLMPHLSLHPTLRTCSSDTILRGISELSCANTTYTSDTGKVYDFNTATKLNSQLVKALMNTGQLVAVIGDLIVGTGDRSLSRRKRQKYNLKSGTLT